MSDFEFESFVNLIRYKTINPNGSTSIEFESFVNLIRYKTKKNKINLND